MVGKNVLEMIWPVQDAMFEGICMVQQEGTTNGTASHLKLPVPEANRILLAVVPGLRVYNHERKLVDYSGFTRGDEQDRGQASLVAQAVVVIQW